MRVKKNCTFADQSGDSNATHTHTQTRAFADSIKEISQKVMSIFNISPISKHTYKRDKNVN